MIFSRFSFSIFFALFLTQLYPLTGEAVELTNCPNFSGTYDYKDSQSSLKSNAPSTEEINFPLVHFVPIAGSLMNGTSVTVTQEGCSRIEFDYTLTDGSVNHSVFLFSAIDQRTKVETNEKSVSLHKDGEWYSRMVGWNKYDVVNTLQLNESNDLEISHKRIQSYQVSCFPAFHHTREDTLTLVRAK